MIAATFHIGYAVMMHTFKKVIKRPVTLTFSFVQPIMWMLFFGFLFQRFALDGLEGVSYIDFLLPGICCMTVLFGASQSGISIIRDIKTGFLQSILRTPANRTAIISGKIIADVTRLLAQAIIVCLLGMMVGASLAIHIKGLLLGVLALVLFAIVYTAISCIIAIKAKEPDIMATFIHVVNMPLLFTSTALVPQKQMPDWLQTISEWNPLTIVVDYLRDGLIFKTAHLSLSGILFLLVLAVLLLFLVSIIFEKIKIE